MDRIGGKEKKWFCLDRVIDARKDFFHLEERIDCAGNAYKKHIWQGGQIGN